MTKRIIFVLITVMFTAFLMGSVTFAWFMVKEHIPPNEFTAGTVLIEAGEVVVANEELTGSWTPGQDGCIELDFTVENKGTKCINLRALFEGQWYERECDTAMVRMNDDSHDFTYKWPSHVWFTYIIHNPNSDRQTFYYYAGRTKRVGEVDVWKENSKLHIEIRLDEGYTMRESQVNVALDNGPYSGPPAFGNWPYKVSYDPEADYHLFEIDWKNEWNNKPLYIGVHSVVCGEWQEWEPENHLEVVSVIPQDDTWKMGEDGYLYYTGDDDCLEKVLAEEEVNLSVKVCLDEDKIDNDFQGKQFQLRVVNFEAIQCTHGAAQDQGWEFTCED